MTHRRTYPEQLHIGETAYSIEKILKEDFFSVNILYRSAKGQRHVLKLSDFRFILGVFLRPLAALMSQHEYRIYQRLAGIEGIPTLGSRYGSRGYFHKYVDGKTLAEWGRGSPLPDDFFDRLGAIVRQIHARRIFYADLNKRGNIIVGNDDKPHLIDFQIGMHFPRLQGRLGVLSERLFEKLTREDVYHLYKLKRHFQPERLTAVESQLAQRSALGRGFNRFFGKPFRRVKRIIYPAGSNETVWYRWRRNRRAAPRRPPPGRQGSL